MGWRWSSSVGRAPARPGWATKAPARAAAAALGLALVPFMALSPLAQAPALASGTTLYAYVGGGAPGPLPASCPQTTTPVDQCTLTEALAAAAPGDIVALATPGSTSHYLGNWTIDTAGTSSSSPVTVEPAPGAPDPALDGNLGRPTGCTTTSCAGPVLTIGTIARTGAVYVENVVHVVIDGLSADGLTIEDGDNTTPTQGGVGSGSGSGVFTLGGAIDNTWGGVLSVADTDFDNNTANFGGAIINANGDDTGSGTLSVTGCTFTGNKATDGDGGAINNSGGGDGAAGALTVASSTFNGNRASGTAMAKGDGGAIDNGDEYGSGGAFAISNSLFIDNTASVDGGAIDNGDNGGGGGADDVPNSVSASTFMDNSARSGDIRHGDGGAIDNADLGGNGYLTVTSSTFIGNTASARGKRSYPHYTANGGAIDNADHGGKGYVTVAGSTFDGNTTYAHGGGNSDGGAIDNADDAGAGTLTVSGSTFEANAAETGAYGSHGGAIDNADDGGTGTLSVSASTFDGDMVIGNGSDDGPLIESRDFGGNATVYVAANIFNGSCGQGTGKGTWTDGGYNISADKTCEHHNAYDVNYDESLSGFLGPLANNGGPTPTISLITTGNPPDLAIGMVPNPTRSLCPATDQRGYTSAASAPCDAGAYQTTGSTNGRT
ncbi:MAG: choice-of-anchor Q domain-containing protein [Acidimicrobiales bacterium]